MNTEVAVAWQQRYGFDYRETKPVAQEETLELIAVEYRCSADNSAAIFVNMRTRKAWIMEGKI